MIGISHIPRCYGYLVTMLTERYLNNSFILRPIIEFIFDMEVP